MNITPILEQEAATLIGVSLRTIRNAVERGDLVRIPGTSKVQHVSKEQAMLFKGMKWVTKNNLSNGDLKKWQEINDAISSIGKETKKWGMFTEEDTRNINQQIKGIQRADPKLAFKLAMLLWVNLELLTAQQIISMDEMHDLYTSYHRQFSESDCIRPLNEYLGMGMTDKRVSQFAETLKGYPQTYNEILTHLIEFAQTLDLAA